MSEICVFHCWEGQKENSHKDQKVLLKLHEKNMNWMVKNQTATRMHLSASRKVIRNSSTPVLINYSRI